MPRLNRFTIKIHTGEKGLSGPVQCKFNGHVLPLENISGGTGPGEVYEGSFSPLSFIHGFTLVGPPAGEWNIHRIDLSYDAEGMGSYEISLGEVTLDETTELNLWKEKPLPLFDV